VKAITCPVILESASTRNDGSLSLRFTTPELKSDEKTALFDVLNLNLKMLLQPVDEVPAELKEIKGEFDRKSPSARLRGCLWVWWKQQGEPGEFDAFYLRRMNVLCEDVKKELT
jgi:hypothetical protein